MNKLDAMLYKVQPKPSILEKLEQDNPYMDCSYSELVDMMDGTSGVQTNDPKFVYAVTVKFCQMETAELKDEDIYFPEDNEEGTSQENEEDAPSQERDAYGQKV